MSKQKFSVLVIKEGTKEKFLRIFQKNDWLLTGEEQRTDEKPYEIIWRTDDSKSTVHYIQDHIMERNYFIIKGENIAQVKDDILDMFSRYLYTEDEIFEMWKKAKSQEEKIRAIYYVGVAAPSEPDSRLLNIFKEAFGDPDSEVRLAAVWAVSYVDWHEVQKLVKDASISDSNEEVRDTAATLMKSYERGIGM